MKNVVFFSRYKKDALSEKLLQALEGTEIANRLLYFCVDCDPTTRKKNNELLEILDVTEVPTIVLEDGTRYVGLDTFKWLDYVTKSVNNPLIEQVPSSSFPINSTAHPPQYSSYVNNNNNNDIDVPGFYEDESQYADPYRAVQLTDDPYRTAQLTDSNVDPQAFIQPINTRIESNSADMDRVVQKIQEERQAALEKPIHGHNPELMNSRIRGPRMLGQ